MLDRVAKKWLIYIVIASSPQINTGWDWVIKLGPFVGFIPAAVTQTRSATESPFQATNGKLVQVEI